MKLYLIDEIWYVLIEMRCKSYVIDVVVAEICCWLWFMGLGVHIP